VQALDVAQLGLFFNNGQCCIASSRVFVQEGIYDKFVAAAAARAAAQNVTDPSGL
jgi:acyl-CoA reductase-like NAD-dependent aldehyde dehydrogenase